MPRKKTGVKSRVIRVPDWLYTDVMKYIAERKANFTGIEKLDLKVGQLVEVEYSTHTKDKISKIEAVTFVGETFLRIGTDNLEFDRYTGFILADSKPAEYSHISIRKVVTDAPKTENL